jgi:NTE family protein
MRMANMGLLPVFQLSPSSPLIQTMMSFMTLGSRRSFTDFSELLRKYIDFDEPALSIGAISLRAIFPCSTSSIILK